MWNLTNEIPTPNLTEWKPIPYILPISTTVRKGRGQKKKDPREFRKLEKKEKRKMRFPNLFSEEKRRFSSCLGCFTEIVDTNKTTASSPIEQIHCKGMGFTKRSHEEDGTYRIPLGRDRFRGRVCRTLSRPTTSRCVTTRTSLTIYIYSL
jgi:hypothetical protein